MEVDGGAAGAAETALAASLTSLHLKTIVKEHHAKPVGQVVLNCVDAGKENLFATVANNQARRRRARSSQPPVLMRSSAAGDGV